MVADWLDGLHAAETGSQDDILAATNAIAEALDAEGWMDFVPRIAAQFGISNAVLPTP
jgi:hypothetical protein